MALQRYTTSVDGTIPIQALLYTDEQLLASQEGVGIYNGLQKSPQHQAGTIHTTSHRLFYIDNKNPEHASFAVDLEYVTQTEYYAGLFTSSPKVTLYLVGKGINQSTTSSSSFLDISSSSSSGSTWECEVCAHKNRDPLGRSPSSAQVCELCGVPRPSSSSQAHSSSTPQLSSSLPSSSLRHIERLTSSASSPAATPSSRLGRSSAIPCPACTFLNHPSLPQCEICGTPLASTASNQSAPDRIKSAPTTRPTSPGFDEDDDDNGEGDNRKMMKVSFRKGGVQGFYTILKRTLKSKAWESRTTQLYKSSSGTTLQGDGNTPTRGGITGILRSVETSAQGRESDLTDALQDLEALMIKARDMVHLAAELNEKLTSATSSNNTNTNTTPFSSTTTLQEPPEEAVFIRSSLSQLGLQMTNIPVTNDMIKDEDKWITELARELAGVLKGMMKDRRREIVALDEVWGGWNRARGVALLPPSTFLQVIPHLPHYTSPPIHKRTFHKTGLTVLHTPPYSPEAFSDRLITKHLQGPTTTTPKTTMEVAVVEDITVALAKEMLDETEMRGEVVRDDVECRISESSSGGGGSGVGEAGVRWWPNVFIGYVWDGHTFDE